MTLKLDSFSGTEMALSLTQEYQPCYFALICSYQDSYASRKEVTNYLGDLYSPNENNNSNHPSPTPQ